MKKTALALTIISTLLLSYTVICVDFAIANPAPLFPLPLIPIRTPPTIVVYSPLENEIYHLPQVILNFTVVKPDTWFSSGQPFGDYIFGNVTSVYYTIDGGYRQNIAVYDIDRIIDATQPQRKLSFSTTLNLTAGVHTVWVGVEADSYYWAGGGKLEVLSEVVQGNSDPVNFTVVLPKPVVVTPTNIVYNASDVPLVFTLDLSATSWIGYSLDGKTTITGGNTTLTGLSNGEHNITVYANDTLGNIYSSKTINFTVASEMKSFPTATVAAFSGAGAVVMVIAGLLVYRNKRKRRNLVKRP